MNTAISALPSPNTTGRAETPMAFVKAIVEAYTQRGMDPLTALNEAQIAPNLLNQADARITATQMEWLSATAMKELDDEALGWFSRRLPWGSYGMLARASISSPTLQVALARWCRHHGLLADDNAVNRMLVEELLGMAGLRADTASSGEEAVERVREQSYDLVLMDVHMPGMDGLTATRVIRGLPHGADLPVLAMTASVLQDERQACLDAGMNAHLAKPIDTQQLFRVLHRWLVRRDAAVS